MPMLLLRRPPPTLPLMPQQQPPPPLLMLLTPLPLLMPPPLSLAPLRLLVRERNLVMISMLLKCFMVLPRREIATATRPRPTAAKLQFDLIKLNCSLKGRDVFAQHDHGSKTQSTTKT
jgi:hypothetical protein